MSYGALAGRVALVTGGASGIGAKCSRLMASRGAVVILADRAIGGAVRIADEIGANAEAVEVDVTSFDGARAMVDAVVDRWGRLDIAVNSAGVSTQAAPLAQVSLDDWHRVVAVNLDGTFLSMRAEIPAMLAGGGGSIVNIASMLGTVGARGGAAYVASKHAVVGLTRVAALDYAEDGIRVNAVCPGYIDTPLLSDRSSGGLTRLARSHPNGRMGQPGDVAALVAFLASDEAAFITGSVHLSDGGYTAQ